MTPIGYKADKNHLMMNSVDLYSIQMHKQLYMYINR